MEKGGRVTIMANQIAASPWQMRAHLKPPTLSVWSMTMRGIALHNDCESQKMSEW